MKRDGWDPEQYVRFREQRAKPLRDLAALVDARPGMRVLDLGCGDGSMTAWLHGHLKASTTLGIDQSAKMLEGAPSEPGLAFVQADIASYEPASAVDLVFSNAALQWVPDHDALFPRLAGWLGPGGQLAVQMPMNWDHPSHRVAAELAAEAPYAAALEGYQRPYPQLSIEAYATKLQELGFSEQVVRMQVYGHLMDSSEQIVEWVSGSLLSAFRARLPEQLYAEFRAEYRERVLAEVGEVTPYFYPFTRLLLWARKPSADEGGRGS